MKRWLLVVCVFAIGCKTKSNAKYCDTTCGDPSQICDQIKHECVPAGSDLGMPDLRGAVDDLSVPGDLAGADLTTVDMTAPPACTMSSTCPSPLPVCDSTAKSCRVCSGAAEDSVCSGRSASTPHCKLAGTNLGSCVQCNVNGDCQSDPTTPVAAPACDANGSCRVCRVHSECASGVCDLTNGTCVVPANIIYVDNVKCGNQTADGSFGAPYCQITDALGHVTATIKYIRLAGSNSSYTNATIQPPNTMNLSFEVHVIGPGKLAAKAASIFTGGQHAVNAQASATGQRVNVYLDGLVMNGGDAGHHGATCTFNNKSGATVFLSVRDSSLWGGGHGIDAGPNCTLFADANIVFQNDIGIVLGGQSTFTVQNTAVARNATRGVQFVTGATNKGFMFNTIGVNGADGNSGGVDCGSTQLIENSIVAQNGEDSTPGTQFFSGNNCVLYNVVVGDDTIVSAGALTGSPVFLSTAANAPDLRLKVDDANSLSMNKTCCIDKVTGPGPSPTPSPLPTSDYDIEPRPKGVSWDIGADEAL